MSNTTYTPVNVFTLTFDACNVSPAIYKPFKGMYFFPSRGSVKEHSLFIQNVPREILAVEM